MRGNFAKKVISVITLDKERGKIGLSIKECDKDFFTPA